ncbi:MAG: response regulator [Deltaproteobacteria bacterium]|nr:response regulator [Deltaproteobacteria bacterium]
MSLPEDSAHLFRNVLLVEDDPSHALLIKRALKGLVSMVTHLDNLASGLDAATKLKPDLIITDLHLPDSLVAGQHKLDHVRRFHDLPGAVPVIVLTSSTSLDDAVEAMRLGARDFIVKNFEGDFKAAIGMALSRLTAALLLEAEKLRLQRETAALRMAISGSKDGFAIIDAAGQIIYSNKSFASFAAFCGASENNIWSIFTPRLNKHEQVRETFEQNLKALNVGGVFHTELTFVNEKAVAFDLSLSGISPAGSSEAGETQSAVWVKDISEEKRREKFQREILSTTTHDLKGPLGAIMISTELLGDMVDKEHHKKENDLIVRIASSAQGAINLIDEFLSARRIQEGNFILRPTLQNLNELAQEAVDNTTPLAVARNITMRLVAEEKDASATVDKMGILRVLGNLLSNAIKFTPKGGHISVEVKAYGDEVHVRVSDTGAGLEPAEVQRIFERFSRLDKHQEIAGTGLGLFVVKSIVNAHGGKVEVSSQVGAGTTFDVTFPRTPPVNERGELFCLDFA